MRPITDRQSDILNYIVQFIESEKMPPTIREIAAGNNINVKSAADHVNALIKKGYLSKKEKLSRSLVVLKQLEEI